MMVTVLMPVYNAARFLRQAIDSILQQQFTDFELVIINDGSTDDSEKIILSYTDPRIRYHKQQNAGVAATLNKGIGLAKGNYIWRHDADDISLPHKLGTAVAYLKQHPDVALCACQVAFMTERGKVAKDFRQPNDKSFDGLPVMEVTRDKFDPYCPITHGTVLVLTSVMRDLGGYRKEFVTGEDVDIWLRLIQKHRAVVLHQVLSYHRLSASSATKVHGWKNAFFRNLSFKFFDQRASFGKDDLQRGEPVVLPEAPEMKPALAAGGNRFRSDLLLYKYPLHLNAGDLRTAAGLVRESIRDGWKIKYTWKAIILPLLGKKIIQKGVAIKNKFK